MAGALGSASKKSGPWRHFGGTSQQQFGIHLWRSLSRSRTAREVDQRTRRIKRNGAKSRKGVFVLRASFIHRL